MQAEIVKFEAVVKEKTQEIARLGQEIQQLNSDIQSHERIKARLVENIGDSTQKIADLSRRIGDGQRTVAQQRKQLEQLEVAYLQMA